MIQQKKKKKKKKRNKNKLLTVLKNLQKVTCEKFQNIPQKVEVRKNSAYTAENLD